MNFLAHLLLAGDDEGLRLGAMLGDFIRGSLDSATAPEIAHRGVQLHRHIDQFIDSLPQVALLREHFKPPFRRYSGIIIDLAFDHELALRWEEFSTIALEQFDQDIRRLLEKYDSVLPEELKGFMRYADRRGLFATYRDENEILFSLKGVGRRLSRPNPLHQVGEILDGVKPVLSAGFVTIYPLVQQEVTAWLQEPEVSISSG